ncbi:unnamed protein product [Heligmosomoides polygyrus]|uniref:HTH_48 domain-containing protein n=1 Tax=Heligmosomoides polygyrus TaxID=6339 RepID=A0A183FJ27_HELPZ|nr:unnamed protein product [Heligmosomoides polygyrus]
MIGFQEYDDSLSELAKKYGTTGQKPDTKRDYIFFRNRGLFPSRTMHIMFATRRVLRSVSEKTKERLRKLQGKRNFACLVRQCFTENHFDYNLKVACVVK